MVIHIIIREVTPISQYDSLAGFCFKKLVLCETGGGAALGSRTKAQDAVINADRCNVSA